MTPRIAHLPDTTGAARRLPNAIRIGDTVYASSESFSPTEPGSGDIRDQTHEAFSSFVALLGEMGARMADLVKLHTFYVFAGEANATAFWQRMTEVRLQYFADPGPAGTALRVKGVPVRRRLIAFDGIASLASDRQRIMPAHAWDWSMPTPLSQGWRTGPMVYAGGQISSDRQGRTVAPDDVTQQAINTMEFLRHVLQDGGASFDDVVSLKIAYQHAGHEARAGRVLEQILAVVRPLVPAARCALTCLGVDLLYEGLKLEIDANAVVGAGKAGVRAAGDRGWGGVARFAGASRAGNLVHVAGLGAPGSGSIDAEIDRTASRLAATLGDVGATLDDVVKLNVLFACDDASEESFYAAVRSRLDALLPTPGPVLSLVRVAGLPQVGQRVQMDAVADLGRPA